MNDCNPTKIPLTNSDAKGSDQVINKSFPYRELIGSLLHLTNKTRPDLSFAVNFTSRFMENPTQSDVNNLKHVLKYLKGNQDLGICYKNGNTNKVNELVAYCDADYAGDIETRRSTTYNRVHNHAKRWTNQLGIKKATDSCTINKRSRVHLSSRWFQRTNLLKEPYKGSAEWKSECDIKSG